MPYSTRSLGNTFANSTLGSKQANIAPTTSHQPVKGDTMAMQRTCQCEHISHFPDESTGLDRQHDYNEPCKYVIRADHGLLICETCDKIGHGFYPPRKQRREWCPIHKRDFIDSEPADPENGPHPNDAENVRFCPDCENDLYYAELESICLQHRQVLGSCLGCQAELMLAAMVKEERA